MARNAKLQYIYIAIFLRNNFYKFYFFLCFYCKLSQDFCKNYHYKRRCHQNDYIRHKNVKVVFNKILVETNKII